MDIHYQFVASGHRDVVNAYESIDKAAERSKRVAEQAGKSIGAVRAGRVGGAASGGDRGVAKYEKELQREAKAMQRAQAQKQRAMERNQRYVAQIRDRHFAETQRAEERAETKKARFAEKAQREESAKLKRATLEKHKWLEEQRHKRESAEQRASDARARKREQSVDTLKGIAGGALLGATGTVAAVITSATKEALSLQEQANRIAINARGPGEEFMNATQLRRGFERTAIETPGTKAQDVADAIQRFVSLTGDVATALKGQGVFAKVASATGGNIGDVAEAAASLSQQFDVKTIDEMKDALAALTFQGKAGAFELKDAAAQFQRLAAAGASFGIPKGVEGVKILGGLTQIARRGTGSAEQAGTATEALLGSFKAKQKDLKAAGIEVFNKKTGEARDIRDLLVETISKVGGSDVGKKQAGLLKIFDRQGMRAISDLVRQYNESFQGTAGSEAEKTAAGVNRLRAEFDSVINAAGNWDDVLDDSAQAQKNASAKLDVAWEQIEASVGENVIPALADLTDKLTGDEGVNAIEPFIEAVGLAAEGLSSLIDILDSAGIIKKKQKTPQQEIQKAERELRRFDKTHAAYGPLSAEDAAKRDALQAKLEAAKRSAFGPTRTPEQLQAMYAASGLDKESVGGILRTLTGPGADIAQVLARKGVIQNDWALQHFAGETQQQTDIRHQMQAEAQAPTPGLNAQINAKDAQRQLDAVTVAAMAAAMALTKAGEAGQGTIFG